MSDGALRRAAGRLAVVPALAVAGWLAGGLPLLLLGHYRPWPAALVAAPLAVAAATFGWVRARPLPGPRWALAATALVAVAFGALAAATSSEHLVLRRDPGAYALTAEWLADHGRLPVDAQPEVFGGFGSGIDPGSPAYYTDGGSVVPQFMPALPLLLAPARWLGGLGALLRLNALLAALALLAVAGLAGRLVGPRAAPLVALGLACSQPVLHAARSPYSEPLAMLLLFGGLVLLVDAERRAEVVAAGALLGSTVLARLDALADLLPLAVLAVGCAVAAARRTPWRPLLAGLVGTAALGLSTAVVLTRPYLSQLRPELSQLSLVAAALTGAALLGAVVVRRGRLVPAPAARARLADLAAWTLVLTAALAYVVRPHASTGRISGGPSAVVEFAQRTTGLAVDGTRSYAEDSLHWLGWYVGLPALVLAVAGSALLVRRALRGAGARPSWPLLAVGVWTTALVLWRPAITPDHPWADRRFVPVVLPFVAIAATWSVARAAERFAGSRRLAVAGLGALVLVVPAALATQPLVTSRTEVGERALVADVCAALGPDAAVVVVGVRARNELPQTIRGLCDLPTAGLAPGGTAALPRAAAAAREHGRRLVLLGYLPDDLAAAGATVPRRVHMLRTEEDARTIAARPRRTWELTFEVWVADYLR